MFLNTHTRDAGMIIYYSCSLSNSFLFSFTYSLQDARTHPISQLNCTAHNSWEIIEGTLTPVWWRLSEICPVFYFSILFVLTSQSHAIQTFVFSQRKSSKLLLIIVRVTFTKAKIVLNSMNMLKRFNFYIHSTYTRLVSTVQGKSRKST